MADFRTLTKVAILDGLQQLDPESWVKQSKDSPRFTEIEGRFDLDHVANAVLTAIVSELNARASKMEQTMSGLADAPVMRKLAAMLEA